MRKRLIYSFILMLLLLFLPTTTFAHKMIIKPIDQSSIQVIYEDGSFSTRTLVTVLNEEGVEIVTGPLDANGYFYFDESRAYMIIADDGIGHRTEWRIEEDVVTRSASYRWFTAAGVVLILSTVATYFYVKTKRTSS